MDMLWKNALLSVMIFWLYLLDQCSFQLNTRVISLSLERPRVVDVNPNLARVINVTSRRPGRFDKTHYINLWVEYYKPMDSGGEVIITIDEFLSNEYRPSFVAFRFKTCDFLNDFMKNNHYYYTTNLSIPLVDSRFNKECCFKPGIYYYPNWTWPLVSLPINFPFVKGRAFVNHTYKGKLVMAGSIDLELKTLPARKYKGRP